MFLSYMKKLDIYLSIYSALVLVVILERLSPTTNTFLQPYQFIRVHELTQSVPLLLGTVLVLVFILRALTNNFSLLQSKRNFFLFLAFVGGAYLYGVGEGWHELASFTFNTYCHLPLLGNLCHGLFINDYYTGDIIFFVGGIFMNVSLMIFALQQPSEIFLRNDYDTSDDKCFRVRDDMGCLYSI